MLSSTLSTEKAAKRIGGSIKHAPQPPQGRCLVWLRNPVAHGTGTVGIVGRLALGRAAKCVWPYFLLGKVPKRIGVAAKFSLHGGGDPQFGHVTGALTQSPLCASLELRTVSSATGGAVLCSPLGIACCV